MRVLFFLALLAFGSWALADDRLNGEIESFKEQLDDGLSVSFYKMYRCKSARWKPVYQVSEKPAGVTDSGRQYDSIDIGGSCDYYDGYNIFHLSTKNGKKYRSGRAIRDDYTTTLGEVCSCTEWTYMNLPKYDDLKDIKKTVHALSVKQKNDHAKIMVKVLDDVKNLREDLVKEIKADILKEIGK